MPSLKGDVQQKCVLRGEFSTISAGKYNLDVCVVNT